MRTTRLRLVIVAALASATLAACGSTPDHRTTAQAPHTISGTAAPSTAAVSTTSPTPSATTAATAHAGSADVLGPFGLGPLTLGMPADTALATGLFGTPTKVNAQDSCGRGLMKADSHRAVWISDKLGVASIDAYGDVATPQGLKIGMPYANLHHIYPGWDPQGITGTTEDGHSWVPVPGNPDAAYRIGVSHGKVSSITIQLNNQDCYE